MVDFKMLSRAARSFVGLQPLLQAKEVDGVYVMKHIYIIKISMAIFGIFLSCKLLLKNISKS